MPHLRTTLGRRTDVLGKQLMEKLEKTDILDRETKTMQEVLNRGTIVESDSDCLLGRLEFSSKADWGVTLFVDGSLKQGVQSDSGNIGIPIIFEHVTQPASPNCLLVACEWRVMPFFRARSRCGVVNCESDISNADEEPYANDFIHDGRWPSWPSDNKDTTLIDCYVEIMRFEFVASDTQASSLWEVASVSPLIDGRYFLLSMLETYEGNEFLMVDKPELMPWHPMLRPGMTFSISNIRHAKLLTVKYGPLNILKTSSMSEVTLGHGQQIEDPTSYTGFITRRVGAFVVELDGDPRLKVFFTHTPVEFGGRGLRVGTKVRVDNAMLLHVNGRLQGFVLSFRSSVTILKMSDLKSHSSICIKMSATQQRELPKGSVVSLFWFFSNLIQLGKSIGCKTETLSFLRELHEEDMVIRSRNVIGEFIHQKTESLLPQQLFRVDELFSVPFELPFAVSIDQLLKRSVNAMEMFLSKTPVFAPHFRYGNHLGSFTFSEKELKIPHGFLIASLTTCPQTGQLLIRDRSGEMEIAINDADRVVYSQAAQSGGHSVYISRFVVVVECFGNWSTFEASTGTDMTLHRPYDMALWRGEYVCTSDREGSMIFRFHLKLLEQPAVLDWIPPHKQPGIKGHPIEAVIMAMNPITRKNASQSCMRLSLWSEIDVTSVATFHRSPALTYELAEGQVYRFYNIKTKTSMSKHQILEYSGNEKSVIIQVDNPQLLARFKECHPGCWNKVSIAELVEGTFIGRVTSIEGIVLSAKLIHQPVSKTLRNTKLPYVHSNYSVQIELRDCYTPHTMQVFIESLPFTPVAPGILKTGITIRILNFTLERSAKSVFGKCRAPSRFQIITDELVRSEEKEMPVLLKTTVCEFWGGSRMFGVLDLQLIQLRAVYLEKRCNNCFWVIDGVTRDCKNDCSRKTSVDLDGNHLVNVKVVFTAEDSSGQCEITATGDTARKILGITFEFENSFQKQHLTCVYFKSENASITNGTFEIAFRALLGDALQTRNQEYRVFVKKVVSDKIEQPRVMSIAIGKFNASMYTSSSSKMVGIALEMHPSNTQQQIQNLLHWYIG